MSLPLVRNGQTKLITLVWRNDGLGPYGYDQIIRFDQPVSHVFILDGDENVELYVNGVTNGKVCITGIEYEFNTEHDSIMFKNMDGYDKSIRVLISFGDKARYWQSNPDGNAKSYTTQVECNTTWNYLSTSHGLQSISLLAPANPRRKFVDIVLPIATIDISDPLSLSYSTSVLGFVQAIANPNTGTLNTELFELSAGLDGTGMSGEILQARSSYYDSPLGIYNILLAAGSSSAPIFSSNIGSMIRIPSQSEIWGCLGISPRGGRDYDNTLIATGEFYISGMFQITEHEY